MERTFYSSDYEYQRWNFDKISKVNDSVVKRGKKYIVKNNIIISKGHTLELDDVDTIKFYKDCALLIEGEIYVTKSVGKKITFRSYNGNLIKKDKGWPNAWRGLIIKGKGIIKNCIFKDSIMGINVLGGDVKIFDNEIISHRYGIRCDKSRVVIQNNSFEQCSDGIFLSHTKGAEIRKNKFFNNGCGVYCYFSSGKIEDNELRVADEEFKKPGYSGIYAYNSNLKIYRNFIIGSPYAIVAGFDTILRLKNNKLSSPKKLHLFNSYMRFNIHIFDPESEFVCRDNNALKLKNNQIEIPRLCKNKKKHIKLQDGGEFNFYKHLIANISFSEQNRIIQPPKFEKIINLIKEYMSDRKLINTANIRNVFDCSKNLKKYSLMYAKTKNKEYVTLIKTLIGKNEEVIEYEIWKLHPCLDIPFSYCLSSYVLCYNCIKKDKHFSEDKKRIEKRVDELCEYLEWWIEEVKGAGNHQDLLAASSLGIAALEFNNNKKSKRWFEIARRVIQHFLEDKSYTAYAEATTLMFEFNYYLKSTTLRTCVDQEELDLLFKNFFGGNIVEGYLKTILK